MSDNKQYYDTYAHEIAALYNSFRSVGFDENQAFELVKICIENQRSYNSFYAELDRKRRNDRLKTSLNYLKNFEEKENKDD